MNLPAQYLPLYRALPRSRDEATSMRALAHTLGIDERIVRDQIKDMRELYHIAVIALPTRNGVWLTDDPKELDHLIACQTSRARSLEESARKLQSIRNRLAEKRLYKPALF